MRAIEIHVSAYGPLQEFLKKRFEVAGPTITKADILGLHRAWLLSMGEVGLPEILEEENVRAGRLGQALVRLVGHCRGTSMTLAMRRVEDGLAACLDRMERDYDNKIAREILWCHLGRYNAGVEPLGQAHMSEALVLTRDLLSQSKGMFRKKKVGVTSTEASAFLPRRKPLERPPQASKFFERGDRMCRHCQAGTCTWPVAYNSRGDLKCWRGIHRRGYQQ